MDPIIVVERIHQAIGYPTAFVVGPAALLAYRNGRIHRRLGLTYAWAMTALYALGTFLTFSRHWADSETFWRNLSFNLLGFWLLFLGWRAMRLFKRREEPAPQPLDWTLFSVLFAASAGLFAFGNGTMKKIALVGAVLAAADLVELRRGFRPRLALFARHVRYMLASFYYVLTVVSIVHLGALPRRVKWLAPVLVGLVVIAATQWALRGSGPHQRVVLRAAVLVTVALSWSLLAYVVWAVAAGRLDPFRLTQA
jgi:hypothetical protein